MTFDLPKPLTPPDCDVSHLPSMLLDVQRLRDSGVAHHENPEVFRASVLLWCAAWGQAPTPSFKNDDRELSGMAGFGRGISEWMAIKAEVMSPFVLCADGRWYHPVVAEKALEQHLQSLLRKFSGAKGNASQGKATGGGSEDVVSRITAAAVCLRDLAPTHELLRLPAVASLLATLPEDGEAAPSDADALGTNRERPASAVGTDGDRPASAEATPRERTPFAPRTQGERRANAKEENIIKPPLPPLPGGDAPGTEDEARAESPLDQAQALAAVGAIGRAREVLGMAQRPAEIAFRFAEAFEAYPEIGRTKFAQAEVAWGEVFEQVGSEERMILAVHAFAKSAAAKAREGRAVPSIATWLRRGDWKPHLPAMGVDTEQARPSRWAGPEELRADVVAHIAASRGGDAQAGEDFARAHLDPCAWQDMPIRAVVSRSATSLQRLRTQCAQVFRHHRADLLAETAGEVAA